MWLSDYLKRRKIDKLQIKREDAQAQLVVYSKNMLYYSEKQEVAALAGTVAALDEKLRQLNRKLSKNETK